MNRRPVGIIVCAVLLSLAGLAALVMALFSGLAAAVVPTATAAASQPGQPQLTPGAFLAAIIFSVLLYLTLAGWSGATAVGLLRMRNWARVSTIVMGAAFVFFGLCGAFGILMVQSALPGMPLPPNADPHLLHLVFVSMGFLALCFAFFGGWCIVYFSIRRTREAFQTTKVQQPPYEQEWQPSEPLAYGDNFARRQPSGQRGAFGLPAPVNGRKRPMSITIISVLLLIGAFSAMIQMLSSAPFFLFGIILAGWPAHIVMLALCAANGVSGIGLLKLEKPAWVLACGVYCVPIVNALAMIVPGARSHFVGFMRTAMSRSTLGNGQQMFSDGMISALTFLSVAVGLAFAGTMLFLLWRAKWAFESVSHSQAAE